VYDKLFYLPDLNVFENNKKCKQSSGIYDFENALNQIEILGVKMV
jgi:hypothetical protein